MKTLHFIYNNEIINFSKNENQNILVNATQMAKLFGKETETFLKSDHAKKFIEELESHLKKQSKLHPFGWSLENKIVDFRGRNALRNVLGNASGLNKLL